MSVELGLLLLLAVVSLVTVSAVVGVMAYQRVQRRRWRHLQIQLAEREADQRIRHLTRTAMHQMLAEVRDHQR